jgi:murein DD-endopeptidase MepM/ murein hydrolase activator NlpD
MTRTLLTRSALAVLVTSLVTSLVVAPAASARVDTAARLQMVWPASGTVTSRFGEWRGSHRHDGIDIGMLRTLRLRAVTVGIVRKTGYAPGYDGYGKVVLLDLPGPYSALYAHLSSVRVKPGQRVRKGQRLGMAGCTGHCSGTHLHFEVRRRGVPVNPLRFLG